MERRNRAGRKHSKIPCRIRILSVPTLKFVFLQLLLISPVYHYRRGTHPLGDVIFLTAFVTNGKASQSVVVEPQNNTLNDRAERRDQDVNVNDDNCTSLRCTENEGSVPAGHKRTSKNNQTRLVLKVANYQKTASHLSNTTYLSKPNVSLTDNGSKQMLVKASAVKTPEEVDGINQIALFVNTSYSWKAHRMSTESSRNATHDIVSSSLGLSTDLSQNPTSCKHRCGEATNFPCSCDEKCVVYKTCCEDLAHFCSDLHNMAITKFRQLLLSSIRCDAMSAVFMVESCPATFFENVSPPKVDDDVLVRDLKNTDLFSTILSGAPVTDYDTGIVYANIYECNRRNSSTTSFAQNLTRVHGAWRVQIGTKDRQSPNKIIAVQQELDISTYSYVPSDSHPHSAGSICYNSNWTLSCISDVFAKMRNKQLTCNTSVVEYYKLRRSLKMLNGAVEEWIQDACAVCLSQYQSISDEKERHFLSGFKVLTSLSETPGYVVYDLHEDERKAPRPVPWWSWTCSTQEMANLQADTQCRVLQCDRRFLISPDGECRKAVEAEISIQKEINYYERVCRIDGKAFVDMLKCILQVEYKLKATNTPYRYSQIYQPRLNINLTKIRMEMYFDAEKFEDHVVNLFHMYEAALPAFLAFVQDYCSQEEIRNREGSKTTRIQSDSTQPQNQAKPQADFLKASSKRMSNPKGTIEKPTDFFCSYCFQLSSYDKILDDAIRCDMSSEYLMGIDIDVKDLDVSTTHLKCLAETFPHLTSTSREVHSSPYRSCLLAIFILLPMR
ncbi:hypothetical protein ElyMa_001050700 [Elysia marginata]|uniref:SMB domain-containing protein n=1 Tax=Elysia marginata TaxID=1093978 RepID=A0AAV4HSA6_9GAST|nr:hypothetical protein ElyMa_001050700 [Elysia marginata]